MQLRRLPVVAPLVTQGARAQILTRPFSNGTQFPHDAITQDPFVSAKQLAAADPHWPMPASVPLSPLILNDGTRVGVRQIQSGDRERLAQFLLGLAPHSYSACFAGNASARQIAARLATGNLAHQKSFVALDDKGTIVGLVDYSATMETECVVGIVVADELRGTGLGPKLLQEAMRAAKKDGHEMMFGYRQGRTAGKTRQVSLDLNKPLRGQHEPRPQEAQTLSDSPLWPPEALA